MTTMNEHETFRGLLDMTTLLIGQVTGLRMRCGELAADVFADMQQYAHHVDNLCAQYGLKTELHRNTMAEAFKPVLTGSDIHILGSFAWFLAGSAHSSILLMHRDSPPDVRRELLGKYTRQMAALSAVCERLGLGRVVLDVDAFDDFAAFVAVHGDATAPTDPAPAKDKGKDPTP